MKISKQTMGILKNFSLINDSININEEGILKTISPGRNIVAVSDIEEKLPKFAIYSLSNFVSVLSIFNQDSIEFDFKEDKVEITEGKSIISYRYTDEEYIAIAELKESKVYKEKSGATCSFSISNKDLSEIQKASKIMDLKNIELKLKDGKGKIRLINTDITLTSNTFEIDVEGQGSCEEVIDVDNLVLYPGDYTVQVFDGMAVKFENKNVPVFYFISTL